MRTSFLFQRRMHFPGPSRPARPARCSAENILSFSVTRCSIPKEIFILFILESPESITVFTPGTVREVSAIELDKIILVTPSLRGLKTLFCSSRVIEL